MNSFICPLSNVYDVDHIIPFYNNISVIAAKTTCMYSIIDYSVRDLLSYSPTRSDKIPNRMFQCWLPDYMHGWGWLRQRSSLSAISFCMTSVFYAQKLGELLKEHNVGEITNIKSFPTKLCTRNCDVFTTGCI